ncbi:hypothetical protein ACJJID_06190 [Microbulbifer sp. CnH-101-G]|uniref:hypothetical protein n=1 Tax=Microbulbifer sp. CnH-101-G TaxID=3243393 RepID=UPI00403A3F10
MPNLPVKPSASSNLSQQSIEHEINTIYYLSLNARLFYKTGLDNIGNPGIRETFENLKDLHENVKNLLDGASFNTSLSTKKWIIERRPIAIIIKHPPKRLINRLIECEKLQSFHQLKVIQSTGDSHLRMALSALTAKQQTAIEQLEKHLVTLNQEKNKNTSSEKLGMKAA